MRNTREVVESDSFHKLTMDNTVLTRDGFDLIFICIFDLEKVLINCVLYLYCIITERF